MRRSSPILKLEASIYRGICEISQILLSNLIKILVFLESRRASGMAMGPSGGQHLK
jgi:hypothetical protein